MSVVEDGVTVTKLYRFFTTSRSDDGYFHADLYWAENFAHAEDQWNDAHKEDGWMGEWEIVDIRKDWTQTRSEV